MPHQGVLSTTFHDLYPDPALVSQFPSSYFDASSWIREPNLHHGDAPEARRSQKSLQPGCSTNVLGVSLFLSDFEPKTIKKYVTRAGFQRANVLSPL